MNKGQDFAYRNGVTPEVMNVLTQMVLHGRNPEKVTLCEQALQDAMDAGFVTCTENGVRITDKGYVFLRRLAMYRSP